METKEFIKYLKEHPELRFWQALSNFSGYHYLGYYEDGFKDLFYETKIKREGK